MATQEDPTISLQQQLRDARKRKKAAEDALESCMNDLRTFHTEVRQRICAVLEKLSLGKERTPEEKDASEEAHLVQASFPAKEKDLQDAIATAQGNVDVCVVQIREILTALDNADAEAGRIVELPPHIAEFLHAVQYLSFT
jgi:hypothetical protein